MHPPSQLILDLPERCPHAIAPCYPLHEELPTAVAFSQHQLRDSRVPARGGDLQRPKPSVATFANVSVSAVGSLRKLSTSICIPKCPRDLPQSEPGGTHARRQYWKMTNRSILTISALFTLAYLSILPPSCGFGDVILLPFAVWIIWLKRLFSSTASRARGQSY
jgi:hypothetical protein